MPAPPQSFDQAPSNGAVSALNRIRFAEFEVDFEERQLRRNGLPVKIQKKPFEILRLLLERPGALVSRERIARTLWPELHVSYERSLNTAVNALRECLGDAGRNFRLIETCSGSGYRFIGPVDAMGQAGTPSTANENSLVEAARRDYLTGKFFFNKMSQEGMTTATAHFSSAIQEDPSSALPYAGLSQIHNVFAFWGSMAPAEAGKRSEEYARSAIWLDAGKPEPYVAMAGVKRILEWDWAGAERLYRKALDLEAGCEEARIWYADLLLCRGRTAEAAQQIDASLAQNPLSQWANVQRGWTYFVTGDYRAGLEQIWRSLVLDPTSGLGHFLLGLIYEQMEMRDDAVTELESARGCPLVHPAVLAALSHVYSTNGDCERARDLLSELTELSEKRYVSPYCFAVVHAGLDDRDACIAELQQAFDRRDIQLQWTLLDPRMIQLRQSDGRLALLLSRMGLQSKTPALTP